MEKVCVLLSTYNGEKYLDEQIESLLGQKNVDIIILVRDDGSTDRTKPMLYGWAEKDSRIQILEQDFGVNFRVAKSFTFLLNQADRMFPDIRYFFFCDQDDVWLEMKCCRAVKHLAKYRDVPALYYSRKKLVDGTLNPLERKDVIRLHHNFWDYFDRSNAFGCTMCMTRPLIELLRDDKYYDNSFLHDNYIYRFCLAMGSPIVCDKTETILYRQHGANVAGAAERNLFRGIKKLFDSSRPHIVRDITHYILDTNYGRLEQKNAAAMKLLIASEKSFCAKIRLMRLYHKQSNRKLKGKLLFDVSILLNYY